MGRLIGGGTRNKRSVRRRADRVAPTAAVIADPTGDQFTDEAAEEDDEGCATECRDVETVYPEQVIGQPGQQSVEHGVEEHPAKTHAPHRPVAKKCTDAAARRDGIRQILEIMRSLNVPRLGFVDGGMFAWAVADEIRPAEEWQFFPRA